MSGSSFKKKGTDIRRIRGTKFSYKKSQLLTSSGNLSLDTYLGGGLAVGTLILVEENGSDIYSNALLRYYIAEGVINEHSFLIADQPLPGRNYFENVPVEVKLRKRFEFLPPDELNIAWRYKNQRSVEESRSSCLLPQRQYDLSESMSESSIEAVSVVECDISKCIERTCKDSSTFIQEPFLSVLGLIKDTLEKKTSLHSSDDSLGTSLLRIAILSFGSPLWLKQPGSHHSLYRFLYALRSLLRSAYAVAFVTLSSVHLQDLQLKDKVYQMSDYVVRLTPFLDHADNRNPMTKGFDGIFEVVKLPHLNSPIYQVPTCDLAFKLTSKKLEIKRLHLPPCVEDSASGDIGCGASSKELDF